MKGLPSRFFSTGTRWRTGSAITSAMVFMPPRANPDDTMRRPATISHVGAAKAETPGCGTAALCNHAEPAPRSDSSYVRRRRYRHMEVEKTEVQVVLGTDLLGKEWLFTAPVAHTRRPWLVEGVRIVHR